MEKKLVKIVFAVLFLLPVCTDAAIYVDGQLYSQNVLNITDSSYNYPNGPIMLTGNSIVNIYALPDPLQEPPIPEITLTEDSVVNIYYEDKIFFPNFLNIYAPAVSATLSAEDRAAINFIYPDGYNFDIEYDEYGHSFPVYAGLQLNVDHPLIANGFTLLRNYDPGVNQVLAPIAGNFQLQDDAVMNFIPEPATALLLLMGIGGIRKIRRH